MVASTSGLWAAGEVYEPYVGRWSRRVAPLFVEWLGVAQAAAWADIGCGTGALTEAILRHAAPRSVHGIDPSAGFVDYARAHVRDERARFEVGDARALPLEEASVDAAVAGLVLNFVPEPEHGVREMARIARPGGVVAAYVWDYAGRMELMRHFWDAAEALDPAAREFDEGRRFTICQPDRLAALWSDAGLIEARTRAIDVDTVFSGFEDYWTPFLGGQAPAPRYAMSLDDQRRAALKESLRARLPVESDGSIRLVARAWAVCGRRR